MRAELEVPNQVKGGTLAFDFFRPDTEEELPLIVCLHGGGWISGQKEDYREEAVRWAARGWACACVTYRLAPLYPFPVPIADVQRFLIHVHANAASLGIDTDRVFVLGNSAGGHLALMAGLCPQVLDGSEAAARPSKVFAICPITDLTDKEFSLTPIAIGFLEQFMGAPYDDTDLRWALASPIHQSFADSPPIMLAHGTYDDIVPVQQSERLASELESQGRPVELMLLNGERHSFSMSAWGHIRDAVEEFFATP